MMNMKRQKQLILAIAGGLTLVLMPLKGWSATADTVTSTNTQTAVQPETSPPATTPPRAAVAISPDQIAENIKHLTAPVREVVTMSTSGVAEDVIKTYVDTSPSTFNLTPQSIVRLKDLNVSGNVIAAMLKHDKVLRDNANMPASSQPIPGMNEPQPGNIPNAQPSDGGYGDQQLPPDYYNQLAAYGNWNYMPDYGWGWQPDSSFWPDYASSGYPWGWLNSGWGFWPGFGWSWFPNSRNHNRNFNGRDNFALNSSRFNNINFKNHGNFQSFARGDLRNGNSAIRNGGFDLPVNNRFNNGFNNGFTFNNGINRFGTFNEPLGSHFSSEVLGSHFGTFGNPAGQGFTFGGGFSGSHVAATPATVNGHHGGATPAAVGGMSGGHGSGMGGGHGGGGGGGGGGGHR